jgi:hypothetical protein
VAKKFVIILFGLPISILIIYLVYGEMQGVKDQSIAMVVPKDSWGGI